MPQTFSDLFSLYRSRKHGLSQNKVALEMSFSPAALSRLINHGEGRTRSQVLLLLGVLNRERVLYSLDEANSLLLAAGLAPLQEDRPEDQLLLTTFELHTSADSPQSQPVPHPLEALLPENQPFLDPQSNVAKGDLQVRWKWWRLISICIALLIGLGWWQATNQTQESNTGVGSTPTNQETSTNQRSVLCQGTECNGQEPKASGCHGDSTTSVLVETQYFSGGSIELWYSNTCHTNWAHVRNTQILLGKAITAAYVIDEQNSGMEITRVEQQAAGGVISRMWYAPDQILKARACAQIGNDPPLCTSFH